MKNNIVFKAKCIKPTETLELNKVYIVTDEKDDYISIINERGIKITVLRGRFGEITYEEVADSGKRFVICSSRTKYNGITTGNKYEVVKESRDFFYIINDTARIKRYAKKFFKPIKKKSEEEKVRERKTAVKKATCLFPIGGEITYGNEYPYKDVKENSSVISIDNDKMKKKNYLRKRFSFEDGK